MNNRYNYSNVTSVSEKEFRANSISRKELVDPDKFTKSDSNDVEKVERLLDLKSGVLKDDEFYLQKYICECEHTLTISDFVLTALVDANHEKSLVIQTFLGNKFVINAPRRVMCFNCGRESHILCEYECSRGYGYKAER